MVTEERTGERDLSYSLSHRRWGDQLYASDIDFIECRIRKNDTEPVAIIETKIKGTRILPWQRNLYLNIARQLNIPAFFVEYKKGMDKFPTEGELEVEPLNDLAKVYISEKMVISVHFWISILRQVHGMHR